MSQKPSGRRVLRWPAVAEKVPLTRQYVGKLEAKGKFPRRVQLGPNSVGWFQDEIDEWLEERTRGPIDLTRFEKADRAA